MKEQTLNQYMDLHYKGDASRVKFVNLDYSVVCSTSQLLEWAASAFEIPSDAKLADLDQDALFIVLWKTLCERRQHYVVLENYPRRMTSEVKNVLEGESGWKQSLGFHLYREYQIQVAFLQNPETKGKHPPISVSQSTS